MTRHRDRELTAEELADCGLLSELFEEDHQDSRTSPASDAPLRVLEAGASRRRCECDVCRRMRHIEQVKARGTKAQMRELIDTLHETLMNVETDADVSNAVIDGSWPDADEIIANKRSKRGMKSVWRPFKLGDEQWNEPKE